MGVWWAIIGALLAPVLPGRGLPVLLAALASAAPILVFSRMRAAGEYPSAAVRLGVFRPFWYVQLGLPSIAAGGALGFLAGAPFGRAASTGRWGLLIAASIFLLAAVAGYIGSRWLRVEEWDACFPDLPAGLDGMRIAQVSDLHVGPHTSRSYLARVARAVRDARPDLIAITGDQVDDYAPDVHIFAEAFAGLSAPLGVFGIPGNHDVYAGWPAVRAGMEAMGIAVLVNEAVEIRHGDGRFWLAGTGDPAGGRGPAAPDLNRTLARVPEGAFTVVLAHNPALWPALARRGVQLTLSGHTHYGQLSIPSLSWSLASPFLEHAMGTHRLGDSLLYINPGTNYWGLPFRIGALPEVTVVTLRRSPGHEAAIERSKSTGSAEVFSSTYSNREGATTLQEKKMKKNLLRGLALAGALSVTSLAAANPWEIGKCYIYCSNGATAGPYWSTDVSCCADFMALCGGYGTAYTQFDTIPGPSRSYCFESLRD